jgi:uncharacterized protein YbcI
MTNPEPTRGQIERQLTQSIQGFFRDRTGQRPTRAVCQLYDSGLTLILENTVSPIERTLLAAHQGEFAQQIRAKIQEVFKPALKDIIEAAVSTTVISVLVDSDLQSGLVSITAILATLPNVRDPETIPKAKLARATSGEEKSANDEEE